MKDDFLTLSMCCLSGWSHCTLPGCPRWLLGCYSIIIVFRSKSQPAKAGNVHMCREVRREGLLSSSSSYLSQLWASLNPIASIMKVNLWLGFLLFFALRSPEIRLTSPFTIFKTWQVSCVYFFKVCAYEVGVEVSHQMLARVGFD